MSAKQQTVGDVRRWEGLPMSGAARDPYVHAMPFARPDPPGSRPDGDPAAMRAAAAELDRLARTVDGLAPEIEVPGWKGRGADAVAGLLGEGRGLAFGASSDLESAARILRDEAEEVARDLRRWRREVEAHERAVEAWEDAGRAPVA